MMRVEQLMNQPAVVCGQHDSAMLAAALMLEHDCGVLPIIDSATRLVGIITDRDVCMAAYTEAMRLRDISICDIMTRDVLYCAPTDTVRLAGRMMQRAQVRRLPVVNEDGEVVGILSASDLVQQAANQDDAEAPMSGSELLKTLAAISGPPTPAAPVEPATTGLLSSPMAPRPT